MVKKPVKRSSKTSVKVGNKAANKANKSKGNKGNKANKRANNVSLAKHRQKLDDENEQADESNPEQSTQEDYNNTSRSENKRKRVEEVDKLEDCELHYKVKTYLKDDMKKRRDKTFALPVKNESGRMVKNTRKPIEETGELVNAKDIKSKASRKQAPVEMETLERVRTPMEMIQEKKESLEKNKQKIALFSRDVLQNPQEEMKKLKELRTMLTYTEVRSSLILRKLILISLCEIYKDIIPSYKIRAWTDKEEEQNVGKDVKTLRDYEETLCRQYKLYIDYINDSIKEMNKHFHDRDREVRESWKHYGIVCIGCLSGLLERKSHFNFTPEIIEIIIQQLTHKVPEISKLAAESVKKLYREDKTLQLSLELTQKITKLLKQKSFGVKGDVLDIFLSLKLKEIVLLEEDTKKVNHKDRQQMSRNDRKKIKEKAQLSIDLEENRLKETLKAKLRVQTRILEQIFLVYFNILKKSPNFKLIPCVLEGLAKFAHLINLEFFDDIVKLMHEMIESERLNFRSKLHCIKTVFIVLSGRGEALTIDPMRFYNSLYNIILRIDTTVNLDNTAILSECIDMMFFKRRKQLPSARLLSFVKRMGIVALQTDPVASAILLDLLRKLLSLNPNTDLLFDNEYQNSGIYQPEVTQPDYANAQNSAMWELYALRRHYNPLVSYEAEALIKEQSLTFQDSKRTANDIIVYMDSEDKKLMETKMKFKK